MGHAGRGRDVADAHRPGGTMANHRVTGHIASSVNGHMRRVKRASRLPQLPPTKRGHLSYGRLPGRGASMPAHIILFKDASFHGAHKHAVSIAGMIQPRPA